MIQFGTGGWRAIIGDGFTKENVQKLAQSVIPELNNKKAVVIGYDRRFLSDIASKWLAEVFIGNHVKVYFMNAAAPTPLVMFAAMKYDVDYSFSITASHNPAVYNGVKIFTKGGRDATEKVTQKLSQNLEHLAPVQSMDFDKGLKEGRVEIIQPKNEYIDHILNFIDGDTIRKRNLRILVDTMHGVSKTTLSIILNTVRCDVDIINDRHDTLFGGKLPAPTSQTLNKLSDMVKENHYDLGIATDGDADRIGIVDEYGNYIHPNLLISLIYQYLLEEKGWKGPVVRNLSTTHLLDRIAKEHGEKCIETPVGFKHISSAMQQHQAIIGGESSGGLTIRGHINGKDGILAASILVEMIAVTNKTIHELVKDLYARYGSCYNEERDYSFSNEKKNALIHTLFELKEIPTMPLPIKTVSYLDGLKIVFEDDSWVSARFSGTEPLLRIFAEAGSKKTVDSLVKTMEGFLQL